MKNKLTPKMVEVLTKSLEKDGDMRITNARLKNALVARGYVELAMGYGYGFGGVQSITPAGREALREHQAFQQSVHPTVATVAPQEVKSDARNSG